MIVKSNKLISEITEEIIGIQKLVIDNYKNHFPELESTIVNPLDYLKVVNRIGNDNVYIFYINLEFK